jgi:hypothetical protein
MQISGDTPALYKGIATHWPLVQAARTSDVQAIELLRSYWQNSTIGLFRMAPETRGRIAYTPDFNGFNFERAFLPFGQLLDELTALLNHPAAPTLYMGSTTLDACLPGFAADHPLELQTPEPPLVSLWLGNRVSVPAHQDWPSNLAVCVAGQRSFTLFPPDAVADLYVGPMELTPAGQPISLVDARSPDLERYPRFAHAAARALRFELSPGDAIYIPSQWWHQVDSTGPLGGLINYWWRSSPAWSDSPTAALWMALATMRDLPPTERAAWRALFDHYVFDASPEAADHIPAHARGMLAPLDEVGMRRLRTLLLNKLKR